MKTIVLSLGSLLTSEAAVPECPPLESHYGGHWHCYPPLPGLQTPAQHGTVCVLACYQQDIDAVSCEAGSWAPHPPGGQVCNLCPPLAAPEHAEVSCSDQYVGPGTSCSLRCDQEGLYFTGPWRHVCREDGGWDPPGPSSFSCHARSGEESLLVVGGLLPSLWPDFISSVDQLTGAAVAPDTVPDLPAGTAYLTAAGLGELAVACFGSSSCAEAACSAAECLVWSAGAEAWFNPREDAAYTPPRVVAREAADSVAYNSSVWVIGGRHANQSLVTRHTVEVFRPHCAGQQHCNYWAAAPELPRPTQDSCTAALGGDLYLTGGRVETGVSDQVVRFNGAEGSWGGLQAAMPVDRWANLLQQTLHAVSRYGHGCAVFQQELYISGGYSYTEGRLARLDIFSPETMAWRQGAQLAVPRNNHRMAALNGILTVVGGYGGRGSPEDLTTIEEYHDDIQEWVVRNISWSLPRRSFGAALIIN